MDTINHFESENPCYRVAHDGQQVLSVTYGAGKTSTPHQILTGASWAEIQHQLIENEISIEDDLVPETETEID